MEFKIKIAFPIVIGFLLSLSSCNSKDFLAMFIEKESVNYRFDQSERSNNLNGFSTIEVPSDDYTLCIAADIHMGGISNFDKFLTDSKSLNVAAVIFNGDISNGNTADYQTLQQHLPDTKQMKYFSLVGNHDLFYNGWDEFHHLFGSATFYFSVKSPQASDLFICIDTGSGTLGIKQLDWLKNVLQEKRSLYRNCIVFTHSNLYRAKHSLTTNPMDEEVLIIMDLFTKYNINIVISGHEHTNAVAKFGNTTYITIDSMKDDNENAGYEKLTIKNGLIDYQFIKIQ